MNDWARLGWHGWRGIEPLSVLSGENAQRAISSDLVTCAREVAELRNRIGQLHKAVAGQLQCAKDTLDLLISDVVSKFDALISPIQKSDLHESAQRAAVMDMCNSVDWSEMYALLTSIMDCLTAKSVANQSAALNGILKLQSRREICLQIPRWSVLLKGEEVDQAELEIVIMEVSACTSSKFDSP